MSWAHLRHAKLSVPFPLPRVAHLPSHSPALIQIASTEHIETWRLPVDYMDLIIYTGFGFPGRDLLFVRSCDAILIGCGRIGTIHEFTIAFEDKKPIGVLQGPWAIKN